MLNLADGDSVVERRGRRANVLLCRNMSRVARLHTLAVPTSVHPLLNKHSLIQILGLQSKALKTLSSLFVPPLAIYEILSLSPQDTKMPVPTSLDRQTASAPASAAASSSKNIWIAAGEGDLERVKDCVDREGISPTAADEFTYTPLHAAASYGHLDILRYLLSHPTAPANAVNTTDSDLDTPLFVCETVESARCLIEEFSADAKHKNADGLTAAQQARENEHEELARYIASVTGESLADEEDDEEEQAVDEDENGVPRSEVNSLTAQQQAEQEEMLDAQTDALMQRVGEIMTRAERDGTDPEPELRTLVSESVLRQIVEGMSQQPSENSVDDAI